MRFTNKSRQKLAFYNPSHYIRMRYKHYYSTIYSTLIGLTRVGAVDRGGCHRVPRIECFYKGITAKVGEDSNY